MRLGGPIFEPCDSAEQWAEAVRRRGYGAAFCPLAADKEHSDATVAAYASAAADADIIIAEVGAWSNPLSPDPATREAALQKCRRALALADRIGANCAVNIVGSLGEKWDGPSADDLTDEAFERVVACVRGIVDAVNPTRAVYALETMPWMYPDSPESYLALLEAIDRPRQVAVHLDPVNLVNCPSRCFRNRQLLEHCFDLLGPQIVSCHAKDICLRPKLTLHIDEVEPGTGTLDYACYLRRLAGLERDVPLMLEHLPDAESYQRAAAYIRRVAEAEGLAL